MKSLFSLHLKIELKRQRLNMLAEEYGREDPRVLALSQQLDRDILELQKQMKKAG
jgi:hypothetical protein